MNNINKDNLIGYKPVGLYMAKSEKLYLVSVLEVLCVYNVKFIIVISN